METVSPQLAVLALTSLVAVCAATAAALRAVLPRTTPAGRAAVDSIDRGTHFLWALVPLAILAAVLAAVAVHPGV